MKKQYAIWYWFPLIVHTLEEPKSRRLIRTNHEENGLMENKTAQEIKGPQNKSIFREKLLRKEIQKHQFTEYEKQKTKNSITLNQNWTSEC